MLIRIIFPHFLLFTALVSASTVKYVSDEERPAYEMYNKGASFQSQGNIEGAIAMYRKAIDLKYDIAEAHMNLGLLYEFQNQLELAWIHHKASVSYSTTTELKAGSLSNLANIMIRRMKSPDTQQLFDVIKVLEEAKTVDPTHPSAMVNLGQLYAETKQYDKAYETFAALLKHHPENAMATMNIGNHYFRSMDYGKAITWLRKAVDLTPDSEYRNKILALNNLAQAYRETNHLNDSIDILLQASSLARFHASPTVEDNIITNADELWIWTLSNLFTIRLLACNWYKLEYMERLIYRQTMKKLAAMNNPKYRDSQGITGLPTIWIDSYTFLLFRFKSVMDDYAINQQICSIAPTHATFAHQNIQNIRYQSRSKQLHVGYLSYDWRDHPMGRLTKGLVTRHNTSRIQSTSISYGLNDRSDVRSHVESFSPHFIDIFSIDRDDIAADEILKSSLHILVDLTSHTFNGRIGIVSRKPAAVTISYLGFPSTSGCSSTDIYLADSRVAPADTLARSFTEKLLYLPGSYQSNDMPLTASLCTANEPISSSSSLLPSTPTPTSDCRDRLLFYRSQRLDAIHTPETSSSSFTPPSSSPLLCSFNSLKKMEPWSLAVWADILRRLPTAYLVLLKSDSFSTSNILLSFAYHGISPSRILFIKSQPWVSHLRRAAGCTLLLDVFVYGAHTTAADVLWQGVPVLALEAFGSGSMPSRVAASMTDTLIKDNRWRNRQPLQQHQQPQIEVYQNNISRVTTCEDIKGYEDIAFRLLSDPATMSNSSNRSLLKIRALRKHLHYYLLRSRLFDYFRQQDSIERGYQAIWEIYSLTYPTTSSGTVEEEGSRLRPRSHNQPLSLPNIGYHIIIGEESLNVARALMNVTATTIITNHRYLRLFSPHNKLVTKAAQLLVVDDDDDGMSPLAIHATMLFFQLYLQIVDIYTGSSKSPLKEPSDQTGMSRDINYQQDIQQQFSAVGHRLLLSYPNHFITLLIKEALLKITFASTTSASYDFTLDNSLEDYIGSIEKKTSIANHNMNTALSSSTSKTPTSTTARLSKATISMKEIDNSILVDIAEALGVGHSPMTTSTLRDILILNFNSQWNVTLIKILHAQVTLASVGKCKSESVLFEMVKELIMITDTTSLQASLFHKMTLTEKDYNLRSYSRSTTDQPIVKNNSSKDIITLITSILESEMLLEGLVTIRSQSIRPEILESFGNNISYYDVSMIFTNHAVCQSQQKTAQSISSAVLIEIQAWLLQPLWYRHCLNIGVLLRDLGDSSTGFIVSAAAVRLMQRQEFESLKAQQSSSIIRSNNDISLVSESELLSNKEEVTSMKKRIVFYCNEFGNAWWPRWGPSSSETGGLGGSEEAVVFLSEELGKLNYLVEIYANPPDSDLGWHHNHTVHWRQYEEYNIDNPPDIFIAWRYSISLGLGERSTIRILWLQDLIPKNLIPDTALTQLDYLLVLSKFHHSFLPREVLTSPPRHCSKEVAVVFPNALSPRYFVDGNNSNDVFVFASSPDRGLREVLLHWSTIRNSILQSHPWSNPRLDVYYGLRPSVLKYMRDTLGVELATKWEVEIRTLLQQPGVNYFGSVDHRRLSIGFATAGFLLYPTRYPETGCITAMRAMALGCIPITSSYIQSALPEVTEGYDLGPKKALVDSSDDAYREWVEKEWLPAVIDAAIRDSISLSRIRKEMKAYARRLFLWEYSARILSNLIDTHCDT